MLKDIISSPIGGSDIKYDCILCSEISGDNALSSMLCENGTDLYDKRFLFETDNLILIQDISPIVSGHCLIVTKDHMCSFAEAGEDIWQELTYVKQAAVQTCIRSSQEYFFFEHGTSRLTQSGGACIEHAHIHFIPAPVNMMRHLAKVSFNPLAPEEIEMKSALSGQLTEYLYYENMNRNGCVVRNPKAPLRKQFVRAAVAMELGLVEWNWISGFFGRLG